MTVCGTLQRNRGPAARLHTLRPVVKPVRRLGVNKDTSIMRPLALFTQLDEWSPDEDIAAQLDFAWAVGLFEGEGCITVFDKRRYTKLMLASTDEDVVRRFHRIVVIGNVSPRQRRPPYKDYWRWETTGDGSAQRLLRRMLPYLGERRRARGLEVIAERQAFVAATRAVRPCPICGEPFSPVRSESLNAKPRKFCSRKCMGRDYTERNRERLNDHKRDWRAKRG